MSFPCATCGALSIDDARRQCTAETIGRAPLRPVPCAGMAQMAAELASYKAAKAMRSRGAAEVVN